MARARDGRDRVTRRASTSAVGGRTKTRTTNPEPGAAARRGGGSVAATSYSCTSRVTWIRRWTDSTAGSTRTAWTRRRGAGLDGERTTETSDSSSGPTAWTRTSTHTRWGAAARALGRAEGRTARGLRRARGDPESFTPLGPPPAPCPPGTLTEPRALLRTHRSPGPRRRRGPRAGGRTDPVQSWPDGGAPSDECTRRRP